MTVPRIAARPLATRLLFFVAGAAVALTAAVAADAPAARLIASYPFGYSFDLYTMFRLAGFLPLWTIVSIAFVLIDSREGWRRAMARGGLLFAAVAASGTAAEILKMVIRRERPDMGLADYIFRPWREAPFSSTGLGWPSSHTAVAFAAVWVLCRLHPRATLLWLFIGAACGFSRLARNDHFVSDVVGGALLAYAVVMVLWEWRSRITA